MIVDGRFIETKMNLTLRFRGSRNQRLIDLNATRASGKLILWENTGPFWHTKPVLKYGANRMTKGLENAIINIKSHITFCVPLHKGGG